MNIDKYLTPNDALRALVGDGNFHVYDVEVSKSIVIMVEKDHAEVAGQIAAHFEKINKEYSLSVRCVVDLDKSMAKLTSAVTEPELDALISSMKADTKSVQLPPQMVGRALRKPNPKEGEWWIGLDEEGDECVRFKGEFNWYDYSNKLSTEDCFTPQFRMYTQEDFDNLYSTIDAQGLSLKKINTEMEALESFANGRLSVDGSLIDWAMKYIESVEREGSEHAKTVTKLSKGLAIITDACKDRGFGDSPYEDIIHLLNQAERKLADLNRSEVDDVYPLIERGTYMCSFNYGDIKVTHPCMWYAGGWHFGSEPLSQSQCNPIPLYRMVRDEPKEMVIEQIEGLPPIGSEVYLSPSRESGDGEAGFIATNPGRKVKIHAHFIDDRGVKLAAYVSCDDAPIIGSVACAKAFENEEEKMHRELDQLLSEVEFSGGDKVLFKPGVEAVKEALIKSDLLKK